MIDPISPEGKSPDIRAYLNDEALPFLEALERRLDHLESRMDLMASALKGSAHSVPVPVQGPVQHHGGIPSYAPRADLSSSPDDYVQSSKDPNVFIHKPDLTPVRYHALPKEVRESFQRPGEPAPRIEVEPDGE